WALAATVERITLLAVTLPFRTIPAAVLPEETLPPSTLTESTPSLPDCEVTVELMRRTLPVPTDFTYALLPRTLRLTSLPPFVMRIGAKAVPTLAVESPKLTERLLIAGKFDKVVTLP